MEDKTAKAMIVKNVFKNVIPKKTLIDPKVIKAINTPQKKNLEYLKSIGFEMGPKTAQEDMGLSKVASALVSPRLSSMINRVGMHKVAVEMLRKEGRDYGNADELNIVKAAEVLGTKLAMINMEYNQMIGGLYALKSLVESESKK